MTTWQGIRQNVTLVPPGEGTIVRRRYGEPTIIKTDGTESGGAYALRENAVPAGFSDVPYHIHHTAEEAFYVLEGQMTVFTPAGTQEAPAGAFVLIPRGTPHAFANHGATPLRWLTFISPAWVSAWIEEESALVQSDGNEEPDPDRQAAIYAKYGLEIIGPPPLAAADVGAPPRR